MLITIQFMNIVSKSIISHSRGRAEVLPVMRCAGSGLHLGQLPDKHLQDEPQRTLMMGMIIPQMK
jgi:hypothetical protein